MADSIKLVSRTEIGGHSARDAMFTAETAARVRDFHRSIPVYAETPLVKLPALAEKLGLGALWVKDESKRFGLNAFKGLGGSYSIARYLAKRLELPLEELNYEKLVSSEIHEKIKDITFVTATDGNHGRGVAWTASCLGVKSVVYLPKGSAQERLDNIRLLGAEAEITPWNYDDTVRHAAAMAEKNGWVMVQDTSWEGYEDIPGWIMQGYMTMALEAAEQLGEELPTHVFLQAGVGAMAGGVTGFISNYYGEKKPVITIVEPDRADCVFQTAEAADGTLHIVTGDMDTIMAGLACGEPCTIGWEVLNAHAENFVSMPDEAAKNGMRALGRPCGSDPKVISGESGAATVGFVYTVMTSPECEKLRRAIGLDENSRVLCFSTEGDTDRENYRRILEEV